MDAPHKVSRKAWLHSELRCFECGLPLSPQIDLVEYVRVNSDTRATGAIVEHKRCGARFLITFDDAV